MMVDLNNDEEVHRRAQEHHRQVMFQYEQQLEREASGKRARGGFLTYQPGGEHSFFLDMARRALYGTDPKGGDDRLRDHGQQITKGRSFYEVRALDETVGQGGAFVAPAYIQSEFDSAAHPLRSTADLCRKFPIPMTSNVIVPAFTSGTAVGVDTTQNQTVTETDPVDTTVSCMTTTITGKVVSTRQLVDNSSPESKIDEVIAADLGAAYGAQLDSAVLTASGSGAEMTGLLNISGASTVAAGSSVAGLVDGIATGYQTMVGTRYRKPNVCIMHPRRWLSGFANGIDLQGRPLALPSTHPAALIGTADDGVVAEWLGRRVILDVNVPTTSGNGSQDYVILGHSNDWLLYESVLNFMADRQSLATQMSVNLIAWRYAALIVRYPSSVCLVGPFNAPTTPGS
jgi:HK97 family phage major capsid protein